jgi:hypothetical protein
MQLRILENQQRSRLLIETIKTARDSLERITAMTPGTTTTTISNATNNT